MPGLAKVLVVDGASMSLEALEAVLTTHCVQVLVAENTDISRMLKANKDAIHRTARRIRSRPVGAAFEVDAAAVTDTRREVSPQGMWDIHDLSISGAFLGTKAPVQLGKAVHLCLVLGNQTARVTAIVMRLQEPSWEHVAGIGVAFQDFAEGAKELLASYIRSQRATR